MTEPLETVSVVVSEYALEPFEAAFNLACRAVGLFLFDETARLWTVEGIKPPGHAEAQLAAGLALASLLTGETPELQRNPTEAGGWLAKTSSSFPIQYIGHRFAIRGTHLPQNFKSGRITIVLDAGVAFGSGEHPSTRGCLLALERVAHRRPRRVLDLGCGSGILAMAASKLLHISVRATDIDRWSVRVARDNAAMNGLGTRLNCRVAAGWQPPAGIGAPYDLVFANILARPLCNMAADLATHLAPRGTAILAGLLITQSRMVLAAHQRAGLVLERALHDGAWATLVLRKPGSLARSA